MIKRYFPSILVCVVGTALSATAFWVASHQEERNARTAFEAAVSDSTATLQRNIDSALDMVWSLGRLYARSQGIARKEFTDFAKTALLRYPGLQALQWIPRIPDGQRDVFEAFAQAEGFPSFQILEPGPEGRLIRASAQGEYFPITYVEPLASQGAWMGLNVIAHSSWKNLMRRTCEADSLLASDDKASEWFLKENGSFLVLQPVYQPGFPHDTIEERRRNLVGFMGGVFSVGEVVQASWVDSIPKTIQVFLYDVTENNVGQLLFQYPRQAVQGEAAAIPYEWTSSLDVAGRSWLIVFHPTAAYGTAHRTWQPGAALAGGLFCTFLLMLYLVGTARKGLRTEKIMAELSEAKAKYRSLAEQIPAVIYTAHLNRVGGTFYMSPPVEKLTGFSPAEWTADPKFWLERIHPDDQERVLEEFGLCWSNQQPFVSEYRVRTKEGKVLWVRDEAAIVHGPDQTTRYLQGVWFDITEFRQAEEVSQGNQRQLRMANQHLQELVDSKDEFVAKVSHELRTPLTAVKEGVSLLQESALGPLNDEQKDFLKTIDENVDRLTEMISNLLDFSKIQAGRLRLIRRRVKAESLVASVMKSYQLISAGRKVEFQNGSSAEVFADPHRILQVLGNFFSNALKFTPADGTITLSVKERPDGLVGISVRDRGIGISKEDLPKLFRKFSQVGDSSNHRRGTGLGLALCKELIELHGGRIEVSSEWGSGSTFSFLLPVYSPAMALRESFREVMEYAQHTQQGSIGMIVWDATPFSRFLTEATSMEDLAEQIRKNLHRDDVVLPLEAHWMVILSITDAKGLQAVKRRLSEILEQRSRYYRFSGGMEPIHLGMATYPADGTDVQTLFAKATGVKEQNQYV